MMPENNFYAPVHLPIEQKNNTDKKTVMIIITVIAAILVCVIAFIGFIQFILNAQKDTEEYKVAYNYLINSESFKKTGADESDIRLNQYSSKINSSICSDSTSRTVEIGFIVKMKSFVIVCHQEDGVWQVCDDCTKFN